jgi:hypothetical protein
VTPVVQARLEPTDRYTLLFLELVGVLLVAPFLGEGPAVRALLVVVVALVVFTSFRATGLQFPRIVLVLIAIATIALIPTALAPGRGIEAVVSAALATGMALGPPNIVRRIFEHRRVTVQLVVAGLCAYLQLGYAFAFGFTTVDAVSTSPLFAQGEVASLFDYVYFSFVTLTTVGYGDLTIVTGVGRALAIVETLLGQIFLVVLVAYLVGTLAGNRRQPNDPGG